MAEMHGDCANYKMDLQRELALWNKNIAEVKASPKLEQVGLLHEFRHTEATLIPEKQITLAVPPEKPTKEPEGTFAGLLQLTPKVSGSYRISAGTKVWIELAGANGQRMVSTDFEMQSKCPKIFKTVIYDLKANETYTLQLTGSFKAVVSLMVSSQVR